MNESTLLTLTTEETSATWINLEQEYDSSTADTVSHYDVNQMLARVMSGESAAGYLDDACTFMRVEEGILYVDLDFYVWPYNMEASYTLSTNLGTIQEISRVELYRSFDAVFDGSSEFETEHLLEGEITPSLAPILSTSGETVAADFEIVDNKVVADREVFAVQRFNGIVKGFKHRVSMPFELAEYLPELLYSASGYTTSGVQIDRSYSIVMNSGAEEATWTIEFGGSTGSFSLKKGFAVEAFGNSNTDFVTDWFTIPKNFWVSWSHGASFTFTVSKKDLEDPADGKIKYSVTNLENEVFVQWEEDGETRSSALQLQIPSCVSSLLSICSEESTDTEPPFGVDPDKWIPYKVLNVYYSTCTGEVIEERWEDSTTRFHATPTFRS